MSSITPDLARIAALGDPSRACLSIQTRCHEAHTALTAAMTSHEPADVAIAALQTAQERYVALTACGYGDGPDPDLAALYAMVKEAVSRLEKVEDICSVWGPMI